MIGCRRCKASAEGPELTSDGQLGVESGGGIFASPNVECAWLDNPFVSLWIPEFHLVLANRERESLGFFWPQSNALEALEFANWTRGGTKTLVNVELCHGVSRHGARVGHVHGDFGGITSLDAALGEMQVRELEGGVTETVAERVKGLGAHVPIVGGEPGSVLWVVGQIVIVKERFLTGDSWPRHRQFAAGIHVAEEHVSDRIAACGSGIPRLEDRGIVSNRPANVQRAAILKHHHGGLAGRDGNLKHLLLNARKVE